jgi:hypothetical protein
MKKLLFMLFVVLTACSQNIEQPWNLVWSDEFDYSGLPDPEKWGNETGFIRNNELQYYTPGRIENSVAANGNLMIIRKLMILQSTAPDS